MPFYSNDILPLLPWKMHFLESNTHQPGPTFLFLHGFLGDHSMWLNLVKKFNHPYILVDLPGHGQSDTIEKDYSLRDIATFLICFLNQKNIHHIHVFGHSMGGYIGLEFLQRKEINVESVFLMHSTADNDDEQKKTNRDRAIAVASANKKLYTSYSIKNLFASDYSNPKILNEQIKKVDKISQQDIIGCLKAMRFREKNTETLRNYDGHKGYYIGDNDQLLDWLKIKQEAIFVDSNLTRIEKGVGHMGHLESFLSFTELFNEWVLLITNNTQD